MAEGLINALWRSMLGQSVNATTEVPTNESEVCRRLVLSGITVSAGGVITAPTLAFGVATVPGGGTGVVTLTNHGVVLGQGVSPVAVTSAGTAGQLLTSNGAAADPTFQAAGLALLANTGTTTTVLHGNAAGTPAYSAVALTADVSGILPTANGGSGIAFFTAAGPTAARVFTFPDAAASVLTTNAAVTVAQGGTGAATLTSHGVVVGQGTSAAVATSAGTAGQFLVSGGASADPTFQTLTILDKSTTEQSVASSVASTSVYSFSVPANTLSTNRTLRLTVTGFYGNTSGGNSTFAMSSVFGATTIASGSLTTFATATGGAVTLVILINANGATGSQRATATINMVPSGVSGLATFSQSGLVNVAYHDALAEDTTGAKTLSVSVQHGTSAASILYKRWAACLELLA